MDIAPAEVSTWFAGLLTAAGVALGMFVKASKAMLDAKKHGAEGDFIERLQKRAEQAEADAREAWATRLADTQALARSLEREIALRADITRLQQELVDVRRLIVRHFPDAADFFPSGPGRLDETPRLR